MIRPLLAWAAAALALSGSSPALAWGDKAHQVVAVIAESHLTPPARDQVQALIGPSRLRDVAMWADQIRTQRPDSKRWHYVNIPLDRAEYVPAKDCARPRAGDCVVEAIARFERVLADYDRPRAERAEALRFVTHFVADLHQPLHAADHRDGGGNDVKVVFFGAVLRPGGRAPWNLHAVWDSGLIERRGLSVSKYVQRLTRQLARQSINDLVAGSVVDWALESHRAAGDTAYRLPPDRVLGDEYADMAFPVIDDLLAKAGVRLAKVLNGALAP
ncbi:MAG: S1/P1 nuclease [Nitrospirota bacterium]